MNEGTVNQTVPFKHARLTILVSRRRPDIWIAAPVVLALNPHCETMRV
jgi:hypothetical protein